jgi:NifU-like protein involved in Fe-S cluster formation
VPAIACASALTELVAGREVDAVRGLSREELEDSIKGVPEASAHASQLAIEAFQKLLEQVKDRIE